MEEWTNALTGVGAAIAAGNQLEKGIWALLVIAANITLKTNNFSQVISSIKTAHKLKIYQWPPYINQLILIISKASPTRFIKAVIIPAPKDLLFW